MQIAFKKLSSLSFKFAAMLALLAVLLIPAIGYAQSNKDSIVEGVGATADCAGLGGQDLTDCKSGTGKVNTTIKNITNILSTIVAIAAVIMIIIAGLRYITSNGDPASVSTAKNIIIYSAVGLVIVGLAQAIVKLVLDKV